MLSAFTHYFILFETNQQPMGYTRCFSFVASSISLCGWQGFIPVGQQYIGLGCGCVLAFLRWPCIGRALAVFWLVRPAVFRLVLAVLRLRLAMSGLGLCRASLGQNLPALDVKDHTPQEHSINARTTTKNIPAMN
jgi:hypothetical protein